MIVGETESTLADGKVLRLRSPAAEDAPALLRFAKELAHESWRNLGNPPEHFDAMTDADEVAYIAAISRHPRGFMIVAFCDGEPVASLGLTARAPRLNAHCAELGIGVLRRMHRLGVGSALLRRAFVEADRLGLWNLSLRVRVSNAGAIALYEREGFLRIGTLRDVAAIDGAFEDEHVYQRLGTRVP